MLLLNFRWLQREVFVLITCRSLRVNALPLLYRTICVMWKHKAGAMTYTVDNRVYKALAKELVEKLEIVTIREPCLANYVRALHISLTSFAAHWGLQGIGSCSAASAKLGDL
ncbi:hypothetical protein DL96DRAFT_877841 [Flagelloscypha sp. PMI_526]|nr:hypothetical protein DL96DRAFT_877841 [Flagelloscypha sp. PMI_526]